MKRAAPPIWPYLDHRSMAEVKADGEWPLAPWEFQLLPMKGWYREWLPGGEVSRYDIAGRKL